MQAAETCVLAELLPCGLLGEFVLAPYEFKRHWIAEEEKFSRVKCEDFGELAQDLVRRMAFAGFQMANVGGRSPDPAGNFLLSQIELTAAFANNSSEGTFLGRGH